MKRTAVIALALLALTTGCASNGSLSEQMADWQGASVGHVYTEWGEPEASETYGGDTVLIWRDRAYQVIPYGAPQNWDATAVICERMIAVDTAGQVTGWRWRGDACPDLHSGRTPALMSQATQ